MKRKFMPLILAGILFNSCDSLSEIAKDLPQIPQTGGLTSAEIVSGLKNALSVGTDTAVGRLTRTNGYLNDAVVKVLLPPEAAPIFDNLSKIPGGKDLVDKTVTAINRAAEDAAKEAAPIFKNAITSMTINDGLGILKGHDSAATDYLRRTTYSPLKNAFSPKIENSLSKPLVFNTSASAIYKNLVDTYNKASLKGALFPMITQNTLSDYVTTKALDGLFHKVAIEEKLIREDPLHRVTDILRRVFSQQNR